MLNRGSQYEIEEKTAAVDKAAALEKLGYKVQIRDLNSGVQGIVIGKDGLLGGADPRREGKVMGDWYCRFDMKKAVWNLVVQTAF